MHIARYRRVFGLGRISIGRARHDVSDSGQIAKGLGISHTSLVLWRQGKRSLRPDLEAKCWSFVTTNGYIPNHSDNTAQIRNTQPELGNVVPRGGLEPPTHGFSDAPDDPIKAFLNDRRARGLSVRTIKFYSDYLRLLQNHLPEPLLVTSRQQLLSVLLDLSCTQGGKQAYIRAARAFFYWAMDNELIDRNPCQRLRIKSPKPLRYTLSLEALSDLLHACDTPTQRLTVMLLADTGVRRAELASIKRADVDLDTRTIKIEGKGAKQRRVRFGPVTASEVANAVGHLHEKDRLLDLDPAGVSSLLVRLEYRTGIKCNAHSFRRMFACEAIRNGMNLFHVQSLLGHSTLGMTRIYAEQVGSDDAIEQYTPLVNWNLSLRRDQSASVSP